ncbi:HAD family hydrolase [Fictibacillus arsenicus]|uniref:Haloacid dehalogenase n=1 Tax=Fictibacillus arsenicus TaxID=255247 RepID=A0A1V3GCK0_9BACL|nr:HAD family hydrolase [Fictibacillus arsenicus]OOE14580.1 haloacid dehalogenase [Fictibacillus arsenicus]
MPIKAVVFDMDDTLFKETDYVLSGFSAVDKWLEETIGLFGFYHHAIELFGKGEKKYIFNRVLDSLKVRYNKDFICQLIDVYRNHTPIISLLEDARYVLNNLQDSIKVGLITDGYLSSQKQKFDALGIQEKFDTVIFTDELGRDHWKPDPLPYELASLKLKSIPSECIYIGDNVNKDFVTAKKLGWLTVHINRYEGIYSQAKVSNEYEADYQINDMKELFHIEKLKHLFKLQVV